MLSDNFKNGTPRLNICISLFLTAMLVHGIALGALLLSTLVPIPKNKRGNKSDSSNYIERLPLVVYSAKYLILLF